MRDRQFTEPLYDADGMRAMDRAAIDEIGLPGIVLMERAGLESTRLIRGWYQPCRVSVCCGAGNNGGDGFVVARLLHEAGFDVEVLLVEADSKTRRDARTNLEILDRLEIPVERVNATAWRSRLEGTQLIIDALLGTGINGPPRPGTEVAITAINAAGAPVVSLDIPSGVDASSGEVPTIAVQADHTVTFHCCKVGLAVAPGRFHAGTSHVVNIGIPARVTQGAVGATTRHGIIGLVPPKDRAGDKYAAGRVVLVGGARGMTGAVLLAAEATMRAGAGIAWAIVPDEIAGELDAAIPEVQVSGAASTPDGTLASDAAGVALERAARADVMVIGPGLGRSTDSAALVTQLLQSTCPLVIDADGISALGDQVELLAARAAVTVLTPHTAELAGLLGVTPDSVSRTRLASALDAAKRTGAIVLLKGEDTIVAQPDGWFLVVSSATSAATAGSGDVLAGTVAAVLAKGVEPQIAAAIAVEIHAESARRAAAELGDNGVVAGDIAARLGTVIAEHVGSIGDGERQ